MSLYGIATLATFKSRRCTGLRTYPHPPLWLNIARFSCSPRSKSTVNFTAENDSYQRFDNLMLQVGIPQTSVGLDRNCYFVLVYLQDIYASYTLD